jgi:indolepyruvate ferredoxin oxidoreductase
MAAHDFAAVEKAARANSTVAQVIEFKRTPSTDDVITKRVALLTAYQDAGYAAQYKQLVDQVRDAESKLGDASKGMKLTDAVARYYYKLMAYKDEYEVARLHTDAAFKAKIEGMFEGDYKLKFHLAPPLLAKRDARGHLVKQEFGPWMMRAFGLLAKFKFLRGGAADIFGYTAERKMERALIVDYANRIKALLPKLTAENLSKATAIASVPEDIRGYGHVKERHLKAAQQKEARLLAEFDAAPAQSKQVA